MTTSPASSSRRASPPRWGVECATAAILSVVLSKCGVHSVVLVQWWLMRAAALLWRPSESVLASLAAATPSAKPRHAIPLYLLQASSNCRGGPLDAYSRLLVSCQPPAAAPGVLSRPRHAHRLDAPTGGLLLAGKSLPGLRGLTRAFAER